MGSGHRFFISWFTDLTDMDFQDFQTKIKLGFWSFRNFYMKWSRDHVLTWCFMTEFMLISQIYWVYKEVIRHQTQHSRLYSYWICTKFQVNSQSGYKTCPANPTNFFFCDLEKLAKSKTQG
jgi:hypothetical protein